FASYDKPESKLQLILHQNASAAPEGNTKETGRRSRNQRAAGIIRALLLGTRIVGLSTRSAFVLGLYHTVVWKHERTGRARWGPPHTAATQTSSPHDRPCSQRSLP